MTFSRPANGEEALETIREEQPNLVFLDVMMPKKNGFDVCNAVKNELGLKHIHIVLLTAKGQEFDRQRGMEVGADLYMTKPFDPDALVAQARSVLGSCRIRSVRPMPSVTLRALLSPRSGSFRCAQGAAGDDLGGGICVVDTGGKSLLGERPPSCGDRSPRASSV